MRIILILNSLSKPTTKGKTKQNLHKCKCRAKIKSLRFPSEPGVCVAVESRFQASVLINNGTLHYNARSDLTDQNLNGKERSCQCFSLVGLVSGQKAIFMNCQKQYQETDHMSQAEGAQFM